MRLPLRLGALGVLSLSGAFACLGSDPDVSGREPTDAGAIDGAMPSETGAPPADAGDGAATGSVISVISRGDFETTGCLGWTPNEAVPASDPDKHGGAFACRVCASGGTSVWGIYQAAPPVDPGGYSARAFVRASADAGPFAVTLLLETFVAGQSTGVARESQATLVPGEGWVETRTEIQVESGQDVSLAILSSTAGGCFLVDDITLVKR